MQNASPVCNTRETNFVSVIIKEADFAFGGTIVAGVSAEGFEEKRKCEEWFDRVFKPFSCVQIESVALISKTDAAAPQPIRVATILSKVLLEKGGGGMG